MRRSPVDLESPLPKTMACSTPLTQPLHTPSRTAAAAAAPAVSRSLAIPPYLIGHELVLGVD